MEQTTTTGPLDDVARGERRKAKKANGKGGAVQQPPIREPGAKRAFEDLPPQAQKIVNTAVKHFKSEFVDVFEEILAGVSTAAQEASFSTTVQIKSAKKGRLRATMTARVRSPREPLEMDLRLDGGQLVLGWDGLEDDGEDE